MSTAIVRSQEQSGLSREQVDLIKATIAKDTTDAELSLFVQTCNRLGLDPFARQIYLVKRWDSQLRCNVAQSQVSIDGFRLVAERTRQYRGQTAPQWCGKDGKWLDVWLADEPPAAARCGVHREGFAEPLYRVAKYTSYVQTTKDRQTNTERPNRMWATMPEVMLAKCAEALALRAAFPNELSGVYTSEEMGQAESDREEPKQQQRPFDGEPGVQSSNTRTRTGTATTATQTRCTTPSTQTSATSSDVLEILIRELTDVSDGDALADYANHATEQLNAARIVDEPRRLFWEAWGRRCKQLELNPKEVAEAARKKVAA